LVAEERDADDVIKGVTVPISPEVNLISWKPCGMAGLKTTA